MRSIHRRISIFVLAMLLAACGSQTQGEQASKLILYSGRSESLVGPLVEQFENSSGIDVEVRWGDTTEIASTLLEEGQNSPADVFFAQDPGGLGAIAGLLGTLPERVLDRVDPRYRDPAGRWVGISGRARVIVYNTDHVTPGDLPADIWGFTEPVWKNRLGWAPTNASFQTMVTAMRVAWGDARTREWLQGILSNEPIALENNTAVVAAVGSGEIDIGFVNHYYLLRFLEEEGESFPARNYFLPGGGPASLVMVAGAGILESSNNRSPAEQFLEFLLSPEAQQYFSTETFEYPLIDGVDASPQLPPLDELDPYPVDLVDLADLQGTVELLRQAGVLP